ncbi:transcriptional regulator [Sphaerisporangium krabiense]|uniref:Transcriptional regulator with XRE-family HTH domain n=1 Tax=Sphaerisporangium krabiense TaxID=763782 RepID=A0A7W8ZB65_9ACTN|nr:helix-turn-helix transcriptional regulator [Sphaerisporangium krabiense]MBB5630705.1 transcriptional regulator with XRE-family HTH domain [Sphaerisporangium krabiense]GII67428.1 transcriptional regulator [Sphaerisporangium krabiense]
MITARAEGDETPLTMMARERGSSTVLRILLGSQLRRLREGRNITLEAAGHSIRASHSKISRMELGRVSFRTRDVADLLTFYGVTEESEREALLSLVTQANRPGWWHNYDDVLPNWFEAYVGLEEAATRIRCYEVQFIPGLLQTEGYARAVVMLGHPEGTEEEIQRRVDLRMARQRLLERNSPPHLWAVIDEAALRRPLGGPDVMRGQIKHLIEAVSSPTVTVQVMPFSAGGHAAAGGPFSILRFAERDLPDVVYLEQLTSAIYLDKREDLDRYQAVMERLCLDAVPVSETKKILQGILDDI